MNTRELGFFSESKETNKTITIIDEDNKFSFLANWHDKDNECMKSIINSFYMGDIELHSGHHVGGMQIRFNLKCLDNIFVKIISQRENFSREDKDFILTKCAAESILKILYQEKCFKRDAVMFQSRDKAFNISTAILVMNPRTDQRYDVSLKGDVISNAYAYLEEGWLCIKLNEINSDQEKNIRKVLSSLFKEVNLAADLVSSISRTSQMK